MSVDEIDGLLVRPHDGAQLVRLFLDEVLGGDQHVGDNVRQDVRYLGDRAVLAAVFALQRLVHVGGVHRAAVERRDRGTDAERHLGDLRGIDAMVPQEHFAVDAGEAAGGGSAELAADDVAQRFHRGIRQHDPVVVRSIGGGVPDNPDWQTGSEAGHGGADRRIGEGDATRKHVAQRGAAPLGGDDIGDIDAILAEQVLL